MTGDGYLMRLLDGPKKGDLVVGLPWPLPERLVHFPETGALAPYEPAPDGGWPEDLGLTFYKKVAESKMPDDVDAMSHVMRGAQYQWEGASE